MIRPPDCHCEDWPCCGCGDYDPSSDLEGALDGLDAYEDDGPDAECDDEPRDLTDVEADADTLRSAGWGMDEDYCPDTRLGEDYDGE